MHLSAHPGRLTAGLATLAAVASMGGTAAVMATRTGSHQGQHAGAVAAAGPVSVTGVAAVPTTTQRPKMPTTHPLGATPRPAKPARALSAAQAVALAAAATKADPDEVEATTGPLGTTYDVKLVREDGSDVEVFVVARTGRLSFADEQGEQVVERSTGDETVAKAPGHLSVTDH